MVMLNDPLGDLLTRIRNGQAARLSAVSSPASKHRVNVLEVLKRESVEKKGDRESRETVTYSPSFEL